MQGPAQRSLALILARELASNLALPMWVVEADGALVFINEAAERLLGLPFAKAAEMARGELRSQLRFSRPDGTPYAREELPLIVALAERRPVQDVVIATSLDGYQRHVSTVCYPLLTTPDHVAGGVAMFWEAE